VQNVRITKDFGQIGVLGVHIKERSPKRKKELTPSIAKIAMIVILKPSIAKIAMIVILKTISPSLFCGKVLKP
jgi:hypothetical protein